MDEFYLKGQLNETCTGVVFHNAQAVSKVIKAWAGIDLDLTIRKFYEKRTSRQNRYLHGVIVPIVKIWALESQGEKWSTEKAKAYIYYEVLGYSIEAMQLQGKEVFWFEGKHFSDMNTKEFNEAKDKVQEYFSVKGVVIPDPKEGNTLDQFI